jgi:hypothetical protein
LKEKKVKKLEIEFFSPFLFIQEENENNKVFYVRRNFYWTAILILIEKLCIRFSPQGD